MAAPTYTQAVTPSSSGGGLAPATAENRLLQLLAILATGTNPDGSAMGPIPVTTTAAQEGTYTDRSGTIANGGAAQQLAAANPARRKLIIINPVSATESLWINFTTTAVAASPSVELRPGDSWEENGTVSTEAVSVIAATTGHAFTAKEM